MLTERRSNFREQVQPFKCRTWDFALVVQIGCGSIYTCFTKLLLESDVLRVVNTGFKEVADVVIGFVGRSVDSRAPVVGADGVKHAVTSLCKAALKFGYQKQRFKTNGGGKRNA